MNVLAIEYSSHQRSIAIARGTAQDASSVVEVVETGGRAANTFAMISAALDQAGLEREQIECIAVGIGPGSYTGIRAAIATAQGWQLATGLRLLGIGSADPILSDAIHLGITGRTAIVIDAQRGEFYVSTQDLNASTPGLPEINLSILPLASVLALEEQGCTLIGPEAPAGSRRFRIVLPRAATLARLALTRSDYVSGESITPIYLRETAFVKHTPTR